ncbi:CD48 antigen-like [Eleutherodactylus coqui]|uniref:CD48 antigen-like n=1 Tax=Eleutherodactylus coqui TaxID=57060 RepID=UPI00346280FF
MTAAAGVLSVLLLLALQIPGGQAGAQRVAGLLHHSVELGYRDLSLSAVDVAWELLTPRKIKVVTYHKGLKTIYQSQFTNRVEISNNGTKLRIKDLRMEDTGVYLLTITSIDGETRDARYNVTVYEPIPLPNVTTVKENATDRCNVTLHCSVSSNTSDQSYTWKYRQNGHYQQYNTGSTIQISLPLDHQDMEFLCIVQNPADQKNVSITVEFCSSTEKEWNDKD